MLNWRFRNRAIYERRDYRLVGLGGAVGCTVQLTLGGSRRVAAPPRSVATHSVSTRHGAWARTTPSPPCQAPSPCAMSHTKVSVAIPLTSARAGALPVRRAVRASAGRRAFSAPLQRACPVRASTAIGRTLEMPAKPWGARESGSFCNGGRTALGEPNFRATERVFVRVPVYPQPYAIGCPHRYWYWQSVRMLSIHAVSLSDAL